MTPSSRSMEVAYELYESLDAMTYNKLSREADVKKLALALDSERERTIEECTKVAGKKFLSNKLEMNTRELIQLVERASKTWDGNHPCELVDSLIPVFDQYAKQKAQAIRALKERR